MSCGTLKALLFLWLAMPPSLMLGAGEIAPTRVPARHIENLFELSPRLLSGGTPDGKEGFAELRRLGVATIISVDGAKPDVEGAREAGMRYIHIPIGYDGAAYSNALRIVKAAHDSAGPVFIHCHHGKHRGPAAAALICRSDEGWSSTNALAWLKAAGTSSDYPGLFKMVEQFRPPTAAEIASIPADFPERARVSTLIDRMVEIDQRWDNLQAIRKAGYRSPAAHPDLNAASEAILLGEQFRELLRASDIHLEPHFKELLRETAALSSELGDLFKNGPVITESSRALADRIYAETARACAGCHQRYRNDHLVD